MLRSQRVSFITSSASVSIDYIRPKPDHHIDLTFDKHISNLKHLLVGVQCSALFELVACRTLRLIKRGELAWNCVRFEVEVRVPDNRPPPLMFSACSFLLSISFIIILTGDAALCRCLRWNIMPDKSSSTGVRLREAGETQSLMHCIYSNGIA